MYKFLILLHIFTSSLFLIVALTFTARSIAGWRKKLTCSKTDRYLSILFISLLYLTLVNGIIMYFFTTPSSKTAMDLQFAIKRASLRFWVIEHFYFMTFALILSQIGSIFIRRTTTSRNCYGYASFYFGIATFITIVSVSFYFIYR